MKPETVGLSSSRLARLDEVMQRRYVDGGYLPGMLTYVYRRGELVHTGICGLMDIDRGRPMREDAIFRIYSMSKPITAVALMMLVEEGLIGLDDLVHTHIPAWQNLAVYSSGMPSLLADAPPSFLTTPVLRPMKVVDLATHTSGLTYGFMMRSAVDAAYRRAKLTDRQTLGGLQGMIDQLARIPLDFSPGTAWNYSVAIDVLGYLVEKLSGISFGQDRTVHLLLSARGRGPRAEIAGRRAGEHLRQAAAAGIGRRRPGVDGARLPALLPHDAERRHARRRADPQPQDGRAVQPELPARGPGDCRHGIARDVQ
jgi:hypothetical protein